ncbi:MAG TPA: histidine phosphatase family protein [Pseudomonas sp.]|jgi:phosphohistidine phosphatase SixA
MMESLFSRIVAHGRAGNAQRIGALAAYRTLIVMMFCLLLALLIGMWFVRASAPVDLAQGRNMRNADIYNRWAKGELVVLVRHAERCDHSTNPCLDVSDGITRKGQAAAIELGNAYRQLGLEKADIFSSPLARTRQTSTYAFNHASTSEDWLVNCRHTLLQDVLRHKADQRNLILVTHSECIDQLERALQVSSRTLLDYGSSLFVAIDPKDHSAHVLGFLDAPDWKAILAKRP